MLGKKRRSVPIFRQLRQRSERVALEGAEGDDPNELCDSDGLRQSISSVENYQKA
jgi:hypothetical protein